MSGPPTKKRCSGGGHDGQLITTSLDEQECILEEGTPVPDTDGGRVDRITTGLVESYMTEPFWQASLRPGGLANLHTAERLLLFPICEVRRRVPQSEILGRLDALNEDHADEVGRIIGSDEVLGQQVAQLLLDIASIASSALELEQTGSATSFTVSEEFLDRAERVADEIGSRTSQKGLVADLDRLIALARQLRETRLSDLISVLESQASSAG